MLARVGYASKGVVYIVMGLLATRAAFRVSSEFSSFRGALLRIVDRPFGHAMLAILALGMAGYALWQILSAAIDAEEVGEGRKAITSRVEQLFTGLVYAGLAKAAGHLLLESKPTAVEIEYRWGNALARLRLGHTMIVIAGAGIIGYGLYQFYRARSEKKLLKRVSLPPLAPATRRAIIGMGMFGLMARGIIFATLGWIIMQAGWRGDTTVASNLADAMRALNHGPAGQWVLGVVALGLMSHGGYQFVNAFYRRLRERRSWRSPRRNALRGEDRREDSEARALQREAGDAAPIVDA